MSLNISGYQGTNPYTVLRIHSQRIPSLPFVDELFQAGVCKPHSSSSTLTHKSHLNERRRKKTTSRLEHVAESGPFLLKAGYDDLPGFECFQSYKTKLGQTLI